MNATVDCDEFEARFQARQFDQIHLIWWKIWKCCKKIVVCCKLIYVEVVHWLILVSTCSWRNLSILIALLNDPMKKWHQTNVVCCLAIASATTTNLALRTIVSADTKELDHISNECLLKIWNLVFAVKQFKHERRNSTFFSLSLSISMLFNGFV